MEYKVNSAGSVDFGAFGRIYEHFLGEFSRTEGQKSGEFYTLAGIVNGDELCLDCICP
jgi:type I restriction-modification system DNA methylase subunit